MHYVHALQGSIQLASEKADGRRADHGTSVRITLPTRQG
jgi:hypothetical protein